MEKPVKLFNKNFFLLWQGQFVSQMGSQAFAVAMMLWIKHQTGSASLMGLLMMVSMIPFVILGPFAGTLADSHSRRKIIIFCDILSGIPVLILACLMFTMRDAPGLLIGGLFLVNLLLGIIRAFFSPAITASIPAIVPKQKVAAANSLNQSSNQISLLTGQALGGYFYVLLGAPVLFLIDGITYLFSALSETFITIPQVIPEKSRIWREKLARFKTDTAEGFKYTWGNQGLRSMLFLAAFINFFSIPIVTLLPFYVEDVLRLTPDWYGYVLAAFGFGSLIGYTLAGSLKISGQRRSRTLLSSLILMALCLPILSILKSGMPALLLMAIIGLFNGFFNINLITILQTTIEDEIRGRVFGLLVSLTAGLTPISMGLSGIIADLINQNISLLYAFCGFITLILTIITAANRKFRGFLQS